MREEQKLRMYRARAGLEEREGRRLSLDEIGQRVAVAQGRGSAYANTVVRRWIEGISEPENTETWLAVATVFGVSAGWLAFRAGPMWGSASTGEPRISGADPYEDGVDSNTAIAARKAAERPPASARAVGQSGPATSAAGPRSAPPSRAKPKKR